MNAETKRTLGTLGLVLAMSAIGCASSPSAGPRGVALLPQAPAEQGKCRVAASQASPLVTEWPASEKSNLEALSRGGGVAVAFAGCSLRVLPQCRVRGAYRWQRTTPSTDVLEINDEDELYAKLPVGAASLEGELKRTGKLSVRTTISGQLRLEDADVASVAQDPACAQATHVVGGLSLGAFAMSTGGAVSGTAGVGALGASIGGGGTRSAGLLRSAGDPDQCGNGTDQGPHGNCASPIQVFLWPLPGRGVEEGPPGTVKVDFVSANPASRWDVYADDEVICSTPCERWVRPERPLLLRSREHGFMSPNDSVQVDNLGVASNAGHVQLQAHPTARGQLATGIVFTSFSGMAVLTGLTLAGVGCGGGEDGFCTPGLITLGVGGVALAGSIWLILDSLPRAAVVPVGGGGGLVATPTRPRVWFGPGGVGGTF